MPLSAPTRLLVFTGAALAVLACTFSCIARASRRTEPTTSALTSAEWAELRQLIVTDLGAPEQCRFANGAPDRRRLIDRCRLACGWTDPAFRQPLLRCLREDDLRPFAVACFLRCDEPDLPALIAPWRDEQVVYHYTGDIVAETTLGEMCATYAASRTLPDWIDPVDVPARVAQVDAMDVAQRRDAFLAVLRDGLLLDARAWRLAPADVDAKAKDHTEYEYALRHLILGRERVIPFLREVAEADRSGPDHQRILELRWSVGDESVANEARARLVTLVERFVDAADPPYETALGPMYRLCDRPDPRLRDLYVRMLRARGTSMADIGWCAYLGLDEPPDPSVIDAPWLHALERHAASDVLGAIATAARDGSVHRLDWADWLVSQREAISFDDWCDGPAWIDAMAAAAGTNFGFNGRCFPSGLNREAVARAKAAALTWYTSLHREAGQGR